MQLDEIKSTDENPARFYDLAWETGYKMPVGATDSVPNVRAHFEMPSDPGLSGQRLKRVIHVKQAPIYSPLLSSE